VHAIRGFSIAWMRSILGAEKNVEDLVAISTLFIYFVFFSKYIHIHIHTILSSVFIR